VLVFEVNEFVFEIRDWQAFLFFPACNNHNKQNSINSRNRNVKALSLTVFTITQLPQILL